MFATVGQSGLDALRRAFSGRRRYTLHTQHAHWQQISKNVLKCCFQTWKFCAATSQWLHNFTCQHAARITRNSRSKCLPSLCPHVLHGSFPLCLAWWQWTTPHGDPGRRRRTRGSAYAGSPFPRATLGTPSRPRTAPSRWNTLCLPGWHLCHCLPRTSFDQFMTSYPNSCSTIPAYYWTQVRPGYGMERANSHPTSPH